MTDPIDLAELQHLVDLIPPETWEVRNQRNWGNRYYIRVSEHVHIDLMVFDDRWRTAEEVTTHTKACMDHIAALHNAIPDLLSELTALREQEQRLRVGCEAALIDWSHQQEVDRRVGGPVNEGAAAAWETAGDVLRIILDGTVTDETFETADYDAMLVAALASSAAEGTPNA